VVVKMAIGHELRMVFACVALLTAGCGGEDDGRAAPNNQPPREAGLDACAGDDAFELQPITNFEPTSAAITIASWFASNDGTADSIEPPASPPPPRRTQLDPPRCGESEYAVRLHASGLKVWGAALGANLGSACVATDNAQGCDASEWDGLGFWARRNPEFTDDAGVEHTSGRTLFAALADRYSHGNQGHCVWDHVRDEEKCDRFGVGVGLDTEWRFHTIRFADMKQRGFGKPSPNASIDLVLYDISLGVEAGDWDIWIDDVSLFRDTP
jgi:hypothetical protein